MPRRLGTENLARDTFVCVTGDKIRDDGNDATEVITHAEEDTSKYFHMKNTFGNQIVPKVLIEKYISIAHDPTSEIYLETTEIHTNKFRFGVQMNQIKIPYE